MDVTKNGVTISIPDAEIVRMAWERVNAATSEIRTGIIAPAIGEIWASQGGIYAGIARGRDGAPDYHLIVGAEYDGTLDWTSATAWAAKELNGGFSDFSLPYRKEQSLCFANVPELLKPEWYWSCEQHAAISDYAWFQDFGYGGQGYWSKGNISRARAVRRLIIR